MPSVNFRLLLITDRHHTQGRSLAPVLAEAVKAGVSAVQLRERDLSTPELLNAALGIRAIAPAHALSLIVNDRLDLVSALDLCGVHLRADSLPVAVARRLLGPQRLIGVSTHSLDEVRQANEEGADYVVFGPVFDTPSKRSFGPPLGLDRLKAACTHSTIPVFAVGGITSPRVPDILRAGAYGVAVIGAILSRKDVAAATKELLAALQAEK